MGPSERPATTATGRAAAVAVLLVVASSLIVSCGRELTSLGSPPTTDVVPTTSAPPPHHLPPPPAQQVAITYGGVTTWNLATGAASFRSVAAIPSPDWSTVITYTLPGGGPPTVAAVDPASGATRWTAPMPGRLRPRVVSNTGDLVVLGLDSTSFLDPQANQTVRRYAIGGRTSTDLETIRADGTRRDYHLPGYLEPEAVSVDGTKVFVIQYSPAEAPTGYRVRQLDLATGSLDDVLTDDGQVVEDMPGSAQHQVRSPDGKRVYTLYTEQSVGHSPHGPAGGYAFVHVLDLEHKWARCVPLPDAFAGGSQMRGALAVAPDGATVVAADVENHLVASMDTDRLSTTIEHPLVSPPTTDEYAPTTASIARNGDVFVGAGRTIQRLDPRTLAPVSSWEATDIAAMLQITALDASTRDGRLTLSSGQQVIVVDARGGQLLGKLESDPQTTVYHLGPTDSRLWRVPGSDKCGC